MLNLNTNYSSRNRSQALQNNQVNFKGEKEYKRALAVVTETLNKKGIKPGIMFTEMLTNIPSIFNASDGYKLEELAPRITNSKRYTISRKGQNIGEFEYHYPYVNYVDTEIKKTFLITCEKGDEILN